ncbi:LamG-like jellyroll fold domain-containing protein [Protofrankia coriariae]|uniref:Concanavalin A-like lectin/glucanases superfamily protein n=1 Tax=Protofrankia coriariae TaxID=1562887 RepID=A0ABR5F548_9ACTN|nr:LamG-like jellyroll fold domain-containing protein [Protofrankia coriariae]KLL11849.1 hypothetical protein FrCorBMG51_08460 [Protofrankia coriariae]
MRINFYEQFTGTNGDPWSASWTSAHRTGASSDIQGNAGRLRTGTSAYTTAARQHASGMTAVADCELLVRYTPGTVAAESHTVVGIRGSGVWGDPSINDAFPAAGYFLEINPQGGDYTVRAANGVLVASTVLATVTKTIPAGGVWIRLRAEGTAISAKVWSAAGSEPAAWDYTGTNSATTAAGRVQLAGNNGADAAQRTHTYDELTVTYLTASPLAQTGMPGQPIPRLGVVFDAAPLSDAVVLLRDPFAAYSTMEAGVAGWVAGANTTFDISTRKPFAGANSLTLTRSGSTGAASASLVLGAGEITLAAGRLCLLWVPVRPAAGVANRTVTVTSTWQNSASVDLYTDSQVQAEGAGYTNSDGWTMIGLFTEIPATAVRWKLGASVAGAAAGEAHHVDGWKIHYFGVDLGQRLRARPGERRGRSSDQDNFEASEFSWVLANGDGQLTPDGAGYDVDIRQRVTLVADYAGTLYPICVGYATGWYQSIPGHGWSEVELRAVDAFRLLSKRRIPPPYRAQVLLTGPRSYYPCVEPQESTAAGNIAGTGGMAQILTSKYGWGGGGFGADSVLPETEMGRNSDAGSSSLAVNVDTTNGAGNVLDLTSAPGALALDGPWSMMLWFSTAPPISIARILFRQIVPGFNDLLSGFQIQFETSGALKVITPSETVYTSGVNYVDGGYHNVVLTYDPTDGTWGRCRVYLDGGEVANVALTGNPLTWGMPARADLGGAWHPWSSVLDFHFQGRMGHVAFWNRILPAGEIYALDVVGRFGGFLENEGNRVGGVLDLTDWPIVDTRIDVGLTDLLARDWAEKTSVLGLAQAITGYGAGELYMGPDGAVVMRNRHHRVNRTSRYTFTGVMSPAKEDLRPAKDDSRLVNSTEVTRTTSGTITVVDQTSIDTYELAEGSSIELAIRSDAEAEVHGLAKLARTAAPKVRVESVLFKPFANAALWQPLLSLEIGDRITIGDLPSLAPGTTIEAFIERIEHFTSGSINTWCVRLQLSPVLPMHTMWQLDRAPYNKLDAGNPLGF